MINAFIDGKEGTTGLQIYERLGSRPDVKILTLPEELRKDEVARAEMLNDADVSFLCLPDDAARRAAELVKNPKARIIDASTAHRTCSDWVYGLPEISAERKSQIAAANRVANPGCHATGFITIAAPLIKGGIVDENYPFVAMSLSGYSGAGKKAIAQYEAEDRDILLSSPRQYALGQSHKHLPEIVKECGLNYAPIFQPVICDFYSGMCVTVPLTARLMNKKCSVEDIRGYFAEYYACRSFIEIPQKDEVPAYIAANELSGTNKLKIYISGNDERIFIASVFDNLGKGASGAAVQNMNIMFGLDETAYLR